MQNHHNKPKHILTFKSKSQFSQKYYLCDIIGKGQFGTLFKIRERYTDRFYSLKIIIAKDKHELMLIQNQIALTQQFIHSRIVDLKQYYIEKIKKEKEQWEIGIVMELANNDLRSDLENRHSKQTKGLWIRKKGIMRRSYLNIIDNLFGLIDALAFLQRNNIAHRDIKPENILVFYEHLAKGTVKAKIWKLCDFGLSINFNECDEKQRNVVVGSMEYCSPLMRQKLIKKKAFYSHPFKDDVYSLGVCILELLIGERTLTQESLNRLTNVLNIDENYSSQQIQRTIQRRSRFWKQKNEEMTSQKSRQVKNDAQWRSDGEDSDEFFTDKTQKKMNSQSSGTSQKQKQKKTKEILYSLTKKMLELQEERRPCFLELSDMIHRRFPQYMPVTVSQVVREQRQNHPSQVNQKMILKTATKFIKTTKSIRCMLQLKDPIENYVICGCRSGELMIIDLNKENDQQIIMCSNEIHSKKYFGGFFRLNTNDPVYRAFKSKKLQQSEQLVFYQQQLNQFWSYGGNSYLVIWNQQSLVKSIRSDVELVEVKEKNIFKKSSNLKSKYFHKLQLIRDKHYSLVELPQKDGFPTCIFCFDVSHILVGYSNGNIGIIWGNIEVTRKMHQSSVTGIRLLTLKTIISSSLDRTVKKLDISQQSPYSNIHPKFHTCDSQIIYLALLDNQENRIIGQSSKQMKPVTINIVTIEGILQTLNSQLEVIYRTKLPSSVYLIDAIQDPKNLIYVLTENGQIIDALQQIIVRSSLISKGWNCISSWRYGLIFGSFEGQIGILQW